MTKTITFGKNVKTVQMMTLAGDKILLVDAATGLPPKKVASRIVGKDLHIFADGAAESSAILIDYTDFASSVQIQGVGQNGSYYDYARLDSGALELSSTPVAAPVVTTDGFMTSAAWWGVGILALGGGAAVALSGGGGSDTPPASGGGGGTTPPPTGTTLSATLIDSVVQGVTYTTNPSGLTGTTTAGGALNYKAGDTITFSVGAAVLGTISASAINADGRITPQDIVGVPRTDTTNAGVVNISRFLLSLDTDNDPSNGIVVNATEAANITTAITVQNATPTELTTAITQADVTNTLVTVLAAQTHLASIAGDTIAPTASISLSTNVIGLGETSLVTIVFSEAVAGFSNADVTPQNGTLSTFTSTDSITWTATFTPTVGVTDASNSITLANTYVDVAGNTGTATSSANYEISTTPPVAPTLIITEDEPMVTANMDGSNTDGSTDANGADILYTFKFSEEVGDFTVADITVTMINKDGSNGTVYTNASDTQKAIFRTFEKVSGDTYTLSIHPEVGFEGSMKVEVLSSAYHDTAGNIGSTSSTNMTSALQAVDMRAPFPTPLLDGSLRISNYDYDHNRMVIAMDESLEQVNQSIPGNFIVAINGVEIGVEAVGISDNSVGMQDNEVFLYFSPLDTLAARFNYADIASNYIEVLYKDSGADLTSIIHDLAGNDATTFSVSLGNPLVVAPTLIITEDEPMVTANMDGFNSDGSTDANGGDILYTFEFSEAVADFTVADITVTMINKDGTNGTAYTDASDTSKVIFRTFEKISDSKYTLSLHPEVGFEGSMKVEVLPATYNDSHGNSGSVSPTNMTSILQAVDMRAPFPLDALHASAVTPIVADPTYHRITLKFDENLEQVSQAEGDAFGVVINGDAFVVSAIGVSDNVAGMQDNEVFLYLENVVNARGELFDWTTAGISVTYTDPAEDKNRLIQDLAGNDVTSFYDFNVDTLSPDAIISIDDTILSSGDIAKMTVSFNEAVTTLDIGDFTVGNGFLQNLSTANGGKTWTADLKANADIDVTGQTVVLNATYSDVHGNVGFSATSNSYSVDTLAPSLLSFTRNTSNKTATFTFDEALDNVDFPPESMFTITDGTLTPDTTDGGALVKYAVGGVSVLGSTATISIDPSISTAAWTITYKNPSGNDPQALQDIYGTDVATFTAVI